jgi:hypothetical protein
MTCRFFELGIDGGVRAIVKDSGAIGRPARSGYVWPLSDSKDILNMTVASRHVVITTTDSAVEVANTKHIRLLWNVVSTAALMAPTKGLTELVTEVPMEDDKQDKPEQN